MSDNQRLRFKVGADYHYVKLIRFQNNKASIEVTSNPVSFDLVSGESKKVDVDGDKYYDLSVSFVRIQSGKPEISIKAVTERVNTDNTPSGSSGAVGPA